MKVSVIYYGLIALLTCNNVYAAVKVMYPEMYIQKIAKRVVEILETRYITGADMPIDDYTAPIIRKSHGIEIRGNVSFHSGFVCKIGAMELNMQRFRNILLEEKVQLEASMLWRDISIALDFNADLEGYQGSGTLLVTFGQFELPLATQRVFATGEVSGTLIIQSIGNQNDIIIVGHPNNAHVQMIAQAINLDFQFRNYLLLSIQRWNFQNILNLAQSEIPFPEVCYNC